ncbi:MAG: putative biotin biosynthesis protein BioY [Xanthobacteraceae bacterium]|nr:MAG: putative biotin biosynthesis protein BioY [Xanthobacteraceae bacterium]
MTSCRNGIAPEGFRHAQRDPRRDSLAVEPRPSRSGATVAAYLLTGLLGAPVFAGWSTGLAPFMGPTGGFLAGFLVMAAIIGAAADRGWDRAWPRILAAMALANIVVFVPGLLWLGTFTGYGAKLLAAGLWPFALGTVVKTALAAAAMPLAWRLVSRLRG